MLGRARPHLNDGDGFPACLSSMEWNAEKVHVFCLPFWRRYRSWTEGVVGKYGQGPEDAEPCIRAPFSHPPRRSGAGGSVPGDSPRPGGTGLGSEDEEDRTHPPPSGTSPPLSPASPKSKSSISRSPSPARYLRFPSIDVGLSAELGYKPRPEAGGE